MSCISSLTCALPCCQEGVRAGVHIEETKLSKILRITSVVMGLLLSITGIFLFTNVFGINQITLGYVLFACGIPLIFAGALLKCTHRLIDKKEKEEPPKKLSWTLTEEEKATLEYMSSNPRIRGGSYIGKEIIKAYECMHAGTPEAFTIEKKHDGQGTHMKEHTNARELLEDVVESVARPTSAVATIIRAYTEEADTRDKAVAISKIIEKTKALLDQKV